MRHAPTPSGRGLVPCLALVVSLLAVRVDAQLELAREFPTEASFRATLRAIQAGADDGFAALCAERRDEEHWTPVLMDGLRADRASEPGEARHRVWASKTLGTTFLNYAFRTAHAPGADVQAEFEADFAALRGWMLAEAGPWDLHLSTGEDGKRFVRLERKDREALVNLVFESAPNGWWSLGIVASAPYVAPPPLETVATLERGFPTKAGFVAVVEAMKAGAYDGLGPLKGLVAPRRVSERHGGVPTWSVMPMHRPDGVAGPAARAAVDSAADGARPDLAPDPEGDLHALADYGGYVSAHYDLGSAVRPDDARREQLEQDFRTLRSWLAEHADGWGTDESFEPWKWQTAESRCFALVPLPGRKVERIDGEEVPRIELLLRKRELDASDGGGEEWSLSLTCQALGSRGAGPGDAPWVLDLLAAKEPRQPLPAIPANLADVVLALVADAPNDFAALREAQQRPAFDLKGYRPRLEDPLYVTTEPRYALTVHLTDAQDPEAFRDCVVVYRDEWRAEAHASLGLLSVAAPNALTRRAVDAWMDEAVARLSARLDGWRVRTALVRGGKEDFQERVTTFDGLREDGHPVWIQVHRTLYPKAVPGHPSGDVMQLSLFVSTDHEATVGEDLGARWRAALERGDEPLASAVRILGDPLDGRLLEGDLVVAPWGDPVDLLSLVGWNGEDEVLLDVIRDRRYGELRVSPPHVSLERWGQLREAHARGEFGEPALSLFGCRLETDALVDAVRRLVASGEHDFADLSSDLAARVVVSTERELHTAALELWRAKAAPTTTFVANLREGLSTAFDGKWIVEPYTRNSGPFWDWLARQTHWSARHEGPDGMTPWVELVETAHDGEVVIALEVRAFSSGQRLANAEHPERLWFQPMTGDCVSGQGVAWCYRDGLTFDGPFADGLPDGTGRHLYPEGKEHTGVVYRKGKLARIGSVPPPPPPFDILSLVRDDYGKSLADYMTPSNWKDDWSGLDDDDVSPRDDYIYLDMPSFRVCGVCGGDGWIDTKRWVDVYEVSSTVMSTSLWVRGYDAVETYRGSRYEYSSNPCSRCAGTGMASY